MLLEIPSVAACPLLLFTTVRWSTTYYTNRMCSETGSLQLILDGPELAKTTKQYIAMIADEIWVKIRFKLAGNTY